MLFFSVQCPFRSRLPVKFLWQNVFKLFRPSPYLSISRISLSYSFSIPPLCLTTVPSIIVELPACRVPFYHSSVSLPSSLPAFTHSHTHTLPPSPPPSIHPSFPPLSIPLSLSLSLSLSFSRSFFPSRSLSLSLSLWSKFWECKIQVHPLAPAS